MWDFLGSVLNGGNAGQTLVFMAVVALLVWLLVKGGVVKVRTKAVSINGDEDERAIMRRQIEHADLSVQAFGVYVPDYIVDGEDRKRHLLDVIFKEVLQWIVFNHMSDSDDYVQIKQEKVWMLVQTFGMEYVKLVNDDPFRKTVNDNIALLIKRLVQIRKNYRTQAR